MDEATALLTERLQLTRAVCQAIDDAGGDLRGDALRRKAWVLWQWLAERYTEPLGSRTRGGLEAMTTPPGARAEMEELHAATAVCDALSVYYSADTFREMDDDASWVARRLSQWHQATHATAAHAPKESES